METDALRSAPLQSVHGGPWLQVLPAAPSSAASQPGYLALLLLLLLPPHCRPVHADCPAVDGWCNHLGSVKQQLDCDGDGLLDWTCKDVDGRRGIMSSKMSCAAMWPDAPVTACPAAFTGAAHGKYHPQRTYHTHTTACCSMRACVRACVCACVHACVCACMCACVCVRVYACMRVCECMRACVHACMRVDWHGQYRCAHLRFGLKHGM